MMKKTVLVSPEVLKRLEEYREEHGAEIRKFCGRTEKDRLSHDDTIRFILRGLQ